jgi:hypothetical protein
VAILRRSSLAFPRQWSPTAVPTWPVEIDSGNAASSSLAGYWLLNGGAPVDLTGRYGGAVAGSGGVPVPTMTPRGPAGSWPGSPAGLFGWTVAGGHILGGLTAWTIVATIQTTTGGNQDGNTIYCERAASGNDIVKIGQQDGHGVAFSAIMRSDGGTLIDTGDGITINDGTIRTLIATYDNANVRQYQNGALTLSTAWSGGNAFTDASTVCSIGYDVADPGTGSNWTGSILQVAIFKSTLSAGQVAQLSAAPFAMLRPIVRRTYSVPAATGAFTGSISDSAASSTSQSGVMASAASVADTAATSDSFTETAAFTGSVTDTVASSDSITGLPSGSNMTSAGTFGDTAASSDNFSATSAFTGSVTDTAATSDSFTGLAAGAYTGSLSDTASSADVFSALAAFTASIADTAATAGSFTGSVPGAYTGGLSDAAVTSDASSSVAAFVASMADSAVTSGAFAKLSGSGNFFFGA